MRDAVGRLAAKFADEGKKTHPLICHMVDVSAVAEAIWDHCLAEHARARLSRVFQLDEESTRRWVAFLAGAHDLGKATPVFQAKGSADRRSTPPWLTDTELAFSSLTATDPGHGKVTAAYLPAFLTSTWGLPAATAERLGVITGGHHGIFPSADSRKKARHLAIGEPGRGQQNLWEEARHELALELADLLAVDGVPAPLTNAASMLLAGFISVVDWIGSIDDEKFFPFDLSGPDDLHAYLKERRRRAAQAVKRLHWDAWPRPKLQASFRDVFPEIAEPRHLQLTAQQAATEISSPGLAILEAPTGEGKTEAAFYLADCWNASGFRGSYIAMPSQATSNQLYERFEKFLARRYVGEKVNLQLLHGHASLSAVKRLGDDELTFSPEDIDAAGEHGDATVGAAEWFTHRKRGLLAPFGVGTIDQALLSVLQVKHGFVRLFGLAGKTVVIDEVHAYDAYMSTLLERLLEWLAALGSPVVLLSATLPGSKTRDLMSAYLRGLGRPDTAPLPSQSYPRITWTGPTGAQARAVEAAPETRRTLGLHWLPFDYESLPAHLLDQLRDGGCAAVICNTVNRAQEVYASLRDACASLPDADRPELDLLHARFLFKDRQEREERCLSCFGKPDQSDGTTAARPRRAILVATQIIEQSLDLDFDLMVSELAPADLLLQRSGRLQRHRRADRRGTSIPVLQLISPRLADDGLPAFNRASTAVYDEHVLLRTWHALLSRDSIAVPEEVEQLIEAVYSESGEPPSGVPPDFAARWSSTFEAMDTKRRGREALANQPLIPSPHFDEEEFFESPSVPLVEDRPDAARERQARTRYEDLPSMRVVWLRSEEAARAAVRKGDTGSVRELLVRSIELRGYWVALLYGDELLPPSWRENAVLRHYRLLVVKDDKYQVPGGPELLRYPELGIVVRFSSQSLEEVHAD